MTAARKLMSRSAIRKSRGDGEVVILTKSRQRKKHGQATAGRNQGWRVDFEVLRDLVIDIDMQRIVKHVAEGMGAFFGERMEAGLRPDYGELPDVDDTTRAIAPRRSNKLGMRSGHMAQKWWIGKLTGGSVKASVTIKPDGSAAPTTDGLARVSSPGRGWTINALLRRKDPVDFQSVRGAAEKRLRELLSEAVEAGMPREYRSRGKRFIG